MSSYKKVAPGEDYVVDWYNLAVSGAGDALLRPSDMRQWYLLYTGMAFGYAYLLGIPNQQVSDDISRAIAQAGQLTLSDI